MACDVRTVLPLPGADGGLAILDRPDGTLALVRSTPASDESQGTRGRTYVRVSADRGVTWTPPAVIAYGTYRFGSLELTGDGQSLLTLQLDTRAANFAQAPFTGGQTRVLNLSDDPNANTYWADMTVLGDGRVLMASGDFSVARWRLFGGGDVYDPNAWATRGSVRRSPTASSSPGRAGPSCSSTSRWPTNGCGRSRRRSRSAPSTRAARASGRPAAPPRTAASSGPRGRSRTRAVACTSSPTRPAPAAGSACSTPAPARAAHPGSARRPCCSARWTTRGRPERPRRRGRRRARLRALARHDQRVGDAAASGSAASTARAPTRTTAGTGNCYGAAA